MSTIGVGRWLDPVEIPRWFRVRPCVTLIK